MEEAQRVADLLARAQKQKAAQRLLTPKGNNALETYREVLRIAPEHTEAQAGIQEIKAQSQQLGEAAEQRGEWAKAQGHYEAALKIDPQDEALKTALRQVKQAQKESTALAGRYETTVQTPVLKEPRSDATVITTLRPEMKVTVVGAVGDYLRVESKKGNPPGYIARQDVTRTQGEPETEGTAQQAALGIPRAPVTQRPAVEEIYQKAQVEQLMTQAAFFFRQRQYNQAVAAYTQVIGLDPRNAMAYNNRGSTYNSQGQYNQAIADFTHAIEFASLPDETSMGYMNRGFAYARLGRDDQAIADYTRAVDLDPRNAIAYYNRGHAYTRKLFYDQARRDFQTACNMRDQDACQALRIPIEKLKFGGTKYEETHPR